MLRYVSLGALLMRVLSAHALLLLAGCLWQHDSRITAKRFSSDSAECRSAHFRIRHSGRGLRLATAKWIDGN